MKNQTIEQRPFKLKVSKDLESAQKELDWFFQFGEASLGIKSNFSSQIIALQTSQHHETADAEDQLAAYIDSKRLSLTPEKLLRNTAKYNKIDRKFQKVSPKNQNVLQIFYYEKQLDKSIEQFFGAGLSLIENTPSFKKLNEKSVHELKHSIIHKKPLMIKIKDEVKQMYLNALEEFANANLK